MHAATILARNVLLEARRSGLPWLGLSGVAAAVVLAAFLSQVALTESLPLQAALVAALLRACGAFLVAVTVASSTAREVADKGLELMLSLPLSRTTQYLGRWMGHAASAVLVALAFSLPLLLWSTPVAVAHWALSLALELALIAALALFFSMAFGQLLPAVAATAGFYLLARVLGTIQSIAQGSLLEASGVQRAAQWLIDAIAFVLPRLDATTRTDWLLYGVPQAGDYAAALAGLVLYTLLLLAAGLIDLRRRNL
jgi:ABC-type transport system involved in multi-copper enzyme maturation permease subunit